jgi:hypothetical protein
MNPALVLMLGLTMQVIGEVPNYLAGLLPSLLTIGRFSSNPKDRAKLRRGEIVGLSLIASVTIGATIVLKANKAEYWYLPLLGAGAVSVVLIHEYERAIHSAQQEQEANEMHTQPEAIMHDLMQPWAPFGDILKAS